MFISKIQFLCVCVSHSVVSDYLRLWDFPGKNTAVGCHSLLQADLPNPGDEPWSPAWQANSLVSEPPRKPCNYWATYKINLLETIPLTEEHNF